ncbi:MAG: hypothetical protein ACJAZX_000860 [Rickettsiales bacterium]|jgi:hypothetical protein
MSSLKNLFSFKNRNGTKKNYIFLLASLIFLLIASPFFDKGSLGSHIMDSGFLMVMMVSIITIGGSRYKMFFTMLLLLPIAFRILVDSQPHNMSFVVTALFFAYVIYLMLIDLFSSKEVTLNIIFGSICVYLLISIFWSFIYILIDNFIPGSFSFGEGAPSREKVGDFLYYSLTTLTTLGYGDFVATSSPARSISVLEAVVGQIYLAILVARFVGIHIGQNINKSK